MRNAILGLTALILGACDPTFRVPITPVQQPRYVEAPLYTCSPLEVKQQEIRWDLSIPRDGIEETVVDHCTNASGDWYSFSLGMVGTTWGYQHTPIEGTGRQILVDSHCTNDDLRFERPMTQFAIPECWDEMGVYMQELSND